MLRRISATFIAALIICFAVSVVASAATLSPTLQSKINSLADAANVGTVIVAFQTSNGLNDSHLAALRSVGITKGITLQRLGMVAAPATAGQVRALAANSAVRSVWSNEQLFYYMSQARVLTGVDRLRTDAALTKANGGLPVSGLGNFSVVINDSGIDATHSDLKFGSHVVQNVQILTDTDTLSGFTPLVAIEGAPNTDSHVGHGTHVAGIIGGTGQQSGGSYAGVAPGAKLIGTGSGAVLFILNAVGGFEWSLANQFLYNIRVVSNSYGSGGDFNPDNPLNIATKAAYDNNIVVVFSAGNSGPGPDTHNTYSKAPWVISVAAGTKEGGLANFSSRGIPKEDRLTDSNPLNDNDAPTITAPGTGREFASNAAKFTSDIVSTRAISNVVANGADADTEIPLAYLPFYTQISGTSMSCPHVAGVVALLLDADPTLNPDEVKEIIQQTATRMPGRADYEVGAGYINAYAAVDKVFNRSKKYGRFVDPTFNTRLTTTYGAAENFTINYTPQQPGPNSTNTHRFTVAPGIGLLDVRIDFGNNLVTDETGNSMGLQLYPPGCFVLACGYSSGLTLPVLDTPRREIIVKSPAPGQWIAEVRGVRGLAAVSAASSPVGIAIPERVDGLVKQAVVTLEEPTDIQGHAAEEQIRGALLNRMMDTFANNVFDPNRKVVRRDFAKLLAFNTPLRQSLGATWRFTDVSQGDDKAIAEAVTANGSTLRDWDFTPEGMMSATGSKFSPSGLVKRLDLAVAFVRALGLDAEARALAGSNVTVTTNGQTLVLTDNADIPSALRGYVQIALNKRLLQAFFTLEQGPFDFQPILKARVKPNDPTTRAFMAFALDNFRKSFIAGN